jgi:hypothetical protein
MQHVFEIILNVLPKDAPIGWWMTTECKFVVNVVLNTDFHICKNQVKPTLANKAMT